MFCPARSFVFEDHGWCSPGFGGVLCLANRGWHGRYCAHGVEVEVDDWVGDEAEDEHGGNKNKNCQDNLRRRTADPAAVGESLQFVAVSAGGAVPVVPLLERVLQTPGREAFLVDVFLAAFAFAWA